VWRGTAKRLLIAAAALCCGPSVPPAGAAAPPPRAWELVSPSDKGGNDVIAESSRTHAQTSAAPGLPSAVAFASLGGFADAIGGGIATEYLAQRTAQPGTSGWTTHAITPAQQPLSVTAAAQQLDPAYEAFSPDLTQAIFRAWSPLTDAPNVAGVENLYVREDLRTPGAGSYRLLTNAAAPLSPISSGQQRPFLAASTADMTHVLLESRLPLAAGTSGGNPTLFKVDGGDAPRLLAPPGGCPTTRFVTEPCSIAALGATALHKTGDALSADGRRVVLTAPVTATGNVSTGTPPSSLYQLDDGGTSETADDALVQLNASELAVPEQPLAARYQAASTDGARVWLTSAERLTDDAPPGGGLYLWERQPEDATQQLTLDASGGTFTLRAQLPTLNAGPDTTAPLPHDASATQVQAALEALANVGAGNVTVSGGDGGPYAIAFGGRLAGVDVPPLVADGSGLTGGAASATVTTVHAVRNLHFVAPGAVLVFGAARDGRRVYFAAPGTVLAGAPAIAEDGVYLWQEDPGGGGSGTTSFVGAISFGDARANADTSASNLQPITSRVTPDGSALLFTVTDENGVGAGHAHGACADNPNATSTGVCAELYVYRAAASTPLAPVVACASCQPSGAPTGANALLSAHSGAGAAQVTSHLSHALSDDGRFVFFSSAAALVPEDANGKVDAYEYDVASGVLRLLSSGRDTADSWFLDASATGDDAFFVTREQLVGWDVDRAYDLYDARVGGGFPEPVAAAAGCDGDACRGQSQAAPPFPALGSATLVLPPAPAARHAVRRRSVRCKRGFVRRKVRGRVRCVRRHGGHHRHRRARGRRRR